MANRPMCDHCDSSGQVQVDDSKQEELECIHCHMAAECLAHGKPSCFNCKLTIRTNTSCAGSIRSERQSLIRSSTVTQTIYPQRPDLQLGSPSSQTKTEKPNSRISTEYMKANAFLQAFITRPSDLKPLYDSQKDGLSSQAFHKKCEDSKDGIIVIIHLKQGYALAGFSWKGIRRACRETSDMQLGAAVIKSGTFDFVPLSDQYLINEVEGIRFSRAGDLYVNFDDLNKCFCKFDQNLTRNPKNSIRAIQVFKLQV